MFIEYGVNEYDELVYIEQVPRGRIALQCPYCGVGLIARKGSVLEHHFAHDGPTCRQVERDQDAIALPVFDKFDLHLTGQQLKALQAFHDGYLDNTTWLENLGLVRENNWTRHTSYELTNLGKIPFGELSLMLFSQYQNDQIHAKYEKMEESIEGSQRAGRADVAYLLTDLHLYRAQWRRILTASLYFIEITLPDLTLYKIGVTTRPIEERLAEIRIDLQAHFEAPQIKVIKVYSNRGNIEHYFKFRYRDYVHRLGSLSEYFHFEDVKAVQRDLNRMKPKEFSPIEQGILDGRPAPVEVELAHYEALIERNQRERQRLELRAQKRAHHITRTKEGMQAAAASGQHVGRPVGSGKTRDEFLSTPEAQRVLAVWRENPGLSIRQTAVQANVSPTTVQKIKRLL